MEGRRTIEQLIERSSLGHPSVKLVREQTPVTAAAAIVEQAERARIPGTASTYQVAEKTTRLGPERSTTKR
jgi:hypothetical protein